MSSNPSFLTNDDDQRWWLIGFLIVFVLFVAMLVSVTLGGALNPEMNALSGALIALFVGCGAFLGALFVDRAGTAIGVFDEQAENLQNPRKQEAKRKLLETSADLDRQINYYLRRVHREFAPGVPADPGALRPAPVSRTESTEPLGVMPPAAPRSPASEISALGQIQPTQVPKSLAQWTPPQADVSQASENQKHGKRGQRRDWAA